MSDLPWSRIRVDWEELQEAFADPSADHRYYLDRETGAVHFFSAYLDNEDEEEDERAMSSDGRYVLIPQSVRKVSSEEQRAFVASLEPEEERRALESTLESPEGHLRFEERIAELPSARSQWPDFVREARDERIQRWLAEVAVEPID